MMSHKNKFLMDAAHGSGLLYFLEQSGHLRREGGNHNRQAWQGVTLRRSEGRAGFNSLLEECGQEIRRLSGNNLTKKYH
jgi:hypothetical protein